MIKKITGFLMVFVLTVMVTTSQAGLTNVFAKTTSEKLEDAKDAQKEAEKDVSEAKDKVSDLKDTKSGLQSNLNQLNSTLTQVSEKIAEIEEQEREKEEDIEETTARLDKAIGKQKEQYAFIKARIRTMYEQGKENYIELFLNTRNFADFLNRAEYVERVNEYDQQMLEKYKELVADTTAEKEKLEEEKKELEALHDDAKAEQEKVQQLVTATKNSITAYAGEISAAEAEALEYESKLIAAKNNVANLQKQLKEEEELARRSQSMKKRSLSEVTWTEGERYLLGAIIQCEAGGEPYAGKIAVGAVIMNRVMSGAFPDTITGVVYQSNQFEPVASGRLAIVLSQGANSTCMKAAGEVLAGANNIGECLFFRTIVPGIKGTIIGHHVFYLYWTGKYSGYGTADEKLDESKLNQPVKSESTESESTESESSESSDDDKDEDEDEEEDDEDDEDEDDDDDE